MSSNENALSKAPEEQTSEEIQSAASRSLRDTQVKRLRVVHVDHFEAAVPLADHEQAAYRRRFCTLFVDDERTRTGGLGRVMFAQNAMGEALALKTMLPAANDTSVGDAAVEKLSPKTPQSSENNFAAARFAGNTKSTGHSVASRAFPGCMAMEASTGRRRSSWNGSMA